MSELWGRDGTLSHPNFKFNRIKEFWIPFLMVMPAGLFTLTMILFPIGYAVFLSFTKWTPGEGITEYVGFKNFIRMFHDKIFWLAFRVTIELFITCLLFETVIGVYLGILLSRDVPGQKIFQALILLPSIIASVAIGMMWILIYDPTLGIANYFLRLLGIRPLAWLGDPKIVVPALAIVDIWEWTPFVALIVTGGMRVLPTEPFEAALIDGANKWQMLMHVILPLLRPVIVVAMLLRSVDLIRFFDTVYIMTKGGPNNASTTLNVYSYLQGFNYMDMSYGSAIMLFLVVLVMFLSLIMSALRRRAS